VALRTQPATVPTGCKWTGLTGFRRINRISNGLKLLAIILSILKNPVHMLPGHSKAALTLGRHSPDWLVAAAARGAVVFPVEGDPVVITPRMLGLAYPDWEDRQS